MKKSYARTSKVGTRFFTAFEDMRLAADVAAQKVIVRMASAIFLSLICIKNSEKLNSELDDVTLDTKSARRIRLKP